jgi:hypothetical protein
MARIGEKCSLGNGANGSGTQHLHRRVFVRTALQRLSNRWELFDAARWERRRLAGIVFRINI